MARTRVSFTKPRRVAKTSAGRITKARPKFKVTKPKANQLLAEIIKKIFTDQAVSEPRKDQFPTELIEKGVADQPVSEPEKDQFPTELIEQIFTHMSAADLVRARGASPGIRQLIKTSPAIGLFTASNRDLSNPCTDLSTLTVHPAVESLGKTELCKNPKTTYWEFIPRVYKHGLNARELCLSVHPGFLLNTLLNETKRECFMGDFPDFDAIWPSMQACQPAVKTLHLRAVAEKHVIMHGNGFHLIPLGMSPYTRLPTPLFQGKSITREGGMTVGRLVKFAERWLAEWLETCQPRGAEVMAKIWWAKPGTRVAFVWGLDELKPGEDWWEGRLFC